MIYGGSGENSNALQTAARPLPDFSALSAQSANIRSVRSHGCTGKVRADLAGFHRQGSLARSSIGSIATVRLMLAQTFRGRDPRLAKANTDTRRSIRVSVSLRKVFLDFRYVGQQP